MSGQHDLRVADLVIVTGDSELTGLAGDVTQIVTGKAGAPDIVVELGTKVRVPIPADQLRKVWPRHSRPVVECGTRAQ